jgi:L-lactate dehydrogenase complex protein LldG
MHEAYRRLSQHEANSGVDLFDSYGYGSFISGPSKTADIAQVLVMGAQAARSVTVLLIDPSH